MTPGDDGGLLEMAGGTLAETSRRRVKRWDDYTLSDHGVWRRLFERRRSVLRFHIGWDLMDALDGFDMAGSIPRLERLSKRLKTLSGWSLTPSAGPAPRALAFKAMTQRRWPVSMSDDLSGGVETLCSGLMSALPVLADPAAGDVVQAIARRAADADKRRMDLLCRLFDHLVGYGLAGEAGAFRARGVELLSSPVALSVATGDPRPHRLSFELARALRARLPSGRMQPLHFVVNDMADVRDAIALDLDELLRHLPPDADLAPGELLAADQVLHRGVGRIDGL